MTYPLIRSKIHKKWVCLYSSNTYFILLMYLPTLNMLDDDVVGSGVDGDRLLD